MRAIGISIATVLAATLLGIGVSAAEPPTASLVRDIKAVGSSDPRFLTKVGGRLFFSATDGVHGRELWATDGTSGGTRLVRDIRPGALGSAPMALARVGSRLFFSATDGIHGRELWVSDGTRKGTRMVRDLRPGSRGSGVGAIHGVGDIAYFDRDWQELWSSDGTARGTRFVHDLGGPGLTDATSRRAILFLPGQDSGSTAAATSAASPSWTMSLWKSDGTTAGTRRLSPRDVSTFGLTRYKGRIYFGASRQSRMGLETPPMLWWSDGTRAGTGQLRTIYEPSDLTVLGGRLYFNGSKDGTGGRLYRSDGTAAGTVPVRPRVPRLRDIVKADGRLWAHRRSAGQHDPDELWVSDGTSAGTKRVHGGAGDWFVGDWGELGGAGLGGRFYFAASPGGLAHGWELVDLEPWMSDGTTEGTEEAADINPDGSSAPRDFVRIGGAILFTATDGQHGRELWRLDP